MSHNVNPPSIIPSKKKTNTLTCPIPISAYHNWAQQLNVNKGVGISRVKSYSVSHVKGILNDVIDQIHACPLIQYLFTFSCHLGNCHSQKEVFSRLCQCVFFLAGIMIDMDSTSLNDMNGDGFPTRVVGKSPLSSLTQGQEWSASGYSSRGGQKLYPPPHVAGIV